MESSGRTTVYRGELEWDPEEEQNVLRPKRLFEQPSTMEEPCAHIKVMPPLGPYKGGQPATEETVGKALWHIAKRTERVTRYRLILSEANVYSIVIQEDASAALVNPTALGSRTAAKRSRPGSLGSSSKCHGALGIAAKPKSGRAGSDPGLFVCARGSI